MLVLMAGIVSACPPQGLTCPAGTVEVYGASVADEKGAGNSAWAVGAPDNAWATIYNFAGNYITLDMGADVVDLVGVDLEMFGDSSSESVNIYVSQNPTSGFEWAGDLTNEGVVNFHATSYDTIRYVKVVNPSYSKYVEVDAVKGCANEQEDVPEFTTLGAALALAGAGFVVWRKKK